MDTRIVILNYYFGKHRYILNAIEVLSKKGYTRSPVNITSTGATAAQTLTAFKSIMVEKKKLWKIPRPHNFDCKGGK